MYIEASWRKENDTARIMSNVYGLSDSACEMEFWYHMKGDHIGSLNVGGTFTFREKSFR